MEAINPGVSQRAREEGGETLGNNEKEAQRERERERERERGKETMKGDM